MTRFTQRAFRPCVTALLVGLWGVPGASLAQQGDLWGLGVAPPDAGLSGQTPQLADPVAEMRTDLDVQLAGFRTAGFAMPEQQDLNRFSDDTLAALQERLKSAPNDCVAAVDMALFLDAHLPETSWTAKLDRIDQPVEMLQRALRAYYAADGLGDDVVGKIAEKLPHMGLVDKALKVVEVVPVINEYTIGPIAARQAEWTQEIFEMSQRGQWDEAQIRQAQSDLLKRAAESGTTMAALSDWLADQEIAIERKLEQRLIQPKKDLADGLDALRVHAMTYGIDFDNDAAIISKRATLTNTYKAAELAALKLREKELLKALNEYETNLRAAELRAVQNQVQYAALAKYARPIAQGKCDKITKAALLDDGVAPAPAEAEKSPEDLLLDGIITLPHDKLLPVLSALGIDASASFLNCLCRKAAYGSSGTSQTYHPDTIGTYDERYSCQHPGDPCVVSGMGCTRHPLPSDAAIWKGCAISTGAPDSQPVTDAILDAMARRGAGAAQE